jgi:hypothetical protein
VTASASIAAPALAAGCILDAMSFPWLTVFLDLPAGSFDPAVAFWQQVTGSEDSFPSWTMLTEPAGHRYCLIDRDPDIAQHSGPAQA